MLVVTEAHGNKIKKSKYYNCATLVIYECIGVLTIIAYVISLVNLTNVHSPIEKIIETFQIKTFRTIIVFFVELNYVFLVSILFFWHWIKNTVVHFTLCQSKIDFFYWNEVLWMTLYVMQILKMTINRPWAMNLHFLYPHQNLCCSFDLVDLKKWIYWRFED